jgi:hypothetical protein
MCPIMGNPINTREIFKQELRRIASLGGKARAKNMTAKQRHESALKASKAAAKARKLKARQKAA